MVDKITSTAGLSQTPTSHLGASQLQAIANTTFDRLKMWQTDPTSITWTILKSTLLATLGKLCKGDDIITPFTTKQEAVEHIRLFHNRITVA